MESQCRTLQVRNKKGGHAREKRVAFPANLDEKRRRGMFPSFPLSILLSLNIKPLVLDSNGVVFVHCLQCDSPLRIHEPFLNEQDPEKDSERLLGVCDCCRQWHLIEQSPDQNEAWIVGLPHAGEIQKSSLPYWMGRSALTIAT